MGMLLIVVMAFPTASLFLLRTAVVSCQWKVEELLSTSRSSLHSPPQKFFIFNSERKFKRKTMENLIFRASPLSGFICRITKHLKRNTERIFKFFGVAFQRFVSSYVQHNPCCATAVQLHSNFVALQLCDTRRFHFVQFYIFRLLLIFYFSSLQRFWDNAQR